MEPFRSPFHRLAPVVLAALGIFGALLTIFAGLVALNHSVLPFKGWPLDAERLNTGTQVLPRAPVETGRLRTAHGGALAAAPDVIAALASGSSPVLHGTVAPTLSVVPGVTVRIHHRTSHPVTHRTESKPAPTPAAPTPAPAPAPVAAAPTPAPAPVATPVVSSPAPVARRPVTASRQPSTSTASTSGARGHGNGGGAGRAHAPGQLKKIAAAATTAGAPVATPAAPPAPAANVGPGNGNGHGHGPPPWAHSQH